MIAHRQGIEIIIWHGPLAFLNVMLLYLMRGNATFTMYSITMNVFRLWCNSCLFVCNRGHTILRHGGLHTNLNQCNQGSQANFEILTPLLRIHQVLYISTQLSMYLFGLRPFRFAIANSYEIISYKCCCPEKLNAINSFYSVSTKLTQFCEYKLCLSFLYQLKTSINDV